jgi:tripartite-type tricarboxylate transporter receptor subunit TctC
MKSIFAVSRFRTLSLLFLLCFLPGIVFARPGMQKAEPYPSRNILMIIPHPRDSFTDISGRALAQLLAREMGVNVRVENQAGASGSLGARAALEAAADGYTLLYTNESLATMRVMGISRISFHDFVPIFVTVNDPRVIVVRGDSRYRRLRDLLDDMMIRPGRVRIAGTDRSADHVQALILDKLGFETEKKLYPSVKDCFSAILGNQADFAHISLSAAAPYLERGDLAILGTAARERLPFYPLTPTLGELVPEASAWTEMPSGFCSLLVRKDISTEVYSHLRQAAWNAILEPEWLSYVVLNSLEEVYLRYGEETAARKLLADWEAWASWMLDDADLTQESPSRFRIYRPKAEK